MEHRSLIHSITLVSWCQPCTVHYSSQICNPLLNKRRLYDRLLEFKNVIRIVDFLFAYLI